MNKIKLPAVLEFSLIIAISLSYFILSAFQWATVDPNSTAVLAYGNNEILTILYYEVGALLIITGLLKWQGRSFSSFGFSFSLQKITTGLVLFVIIYFIYVLMFRLFGDFVLSLNFLNNSSTENITYSMKVDLLPLFIFSIINPLFEEFILVGYIVTAVRGRFSLVTCVVLSVGFRLAFHVYQGPIILLSVLPMGVLFTSYFWYKRSIVPLIVAHSILDFLSFFVFMTMENNL
jgi:CAAX protease family protein